MATEPIHSDTVKLLDNVTGPTVFRVANAPARLVVSGAGTLKSWTGNDWDTGETLSAAQTITSPGLYQLTLDSAGYATLQESEH